MAPTYTPQNAIDYVRKFVRDVPVTSIDSQTCDIINGIIHTYYPWKWSIGDLTGIDLVEGQQDYTIIDSDIYRLLRVRIVSAYGSPAWYGPPLVILNHIEPNLNPIGYQSIADCAFEPVFGRLRLSSAASVGVEVGAVDIQGEYQFLPTKIGDSQLATAFLFPDVYFGAFVEGLKWKLYEYTEHPKAGTATVNKSGQVVYTGQMGVFYGALQALAAAEDYAAQESMSPEIPIGASWDCW